MPKPIQSNKRGAKKKPFGDVPLYLHRTGQWAKKIRGRTIYFGADADSALRKYLELRDDLQAGRTPRGQGDGFSVRDLSNRFLTQKKSMVNIRRASRQQFGRPAAQVERELQAAYEA